jgi:hypothetical protein
VPWIGILAGQAKFVQVLFEMSWIVQAALALAVLGIAGYGLFGDFRQTQKEIALPEAGL